MSLINNYISKQKGKISEKELNMVKGYTVELLEFLYATYGTKFKNNITEESKRIWATNLLGLTEDQIINGMEKLNKTNPVFPPSAMEFRNLCTDNNENDLKQFKDMK